jgi:hypothetical protein
MEYTIKVTDQELQAILQGLGELPLKLSLNLFGKIQQQIHESQAADNEESSESFETHT